MDKCFLGGIFITMMLALGGCKAMSGGEESTQSEARHYGVSVSVEPAAAAARVRLLKMSAAENERVELIVTEGEGNYLDELHIKTAAGLELPVFHGRGSNIHAFTMPAGDVHISAAFTGLPSKNTNLSGIIPSSGTLEPAFDPSELDYLLRLEPGTAQSISFELPREQPGAGVAEASAGGKTLSPLAEGVTVHTVTVRAQDPHFEKTYTIRIEKKPDARVKEIRIVSPDAPLYPWTYSGAALRGEIAPKLPYVRDNPAPIRVEITLFDPRARISSDGSIITAAVSDVPLANGAALAFSVRSSRTIEGVTGEEAFHFNFSRAAPTALKASGGDVVKVIWDTEKNRYDEIHIFKTGAGTFIPPAGVREAWILVAGAGGNSVHNRQGGLGGAGGAVIENERFALDAASYAVSAAAPGLAAAAASVFGEIRAAGGAANSNAGANITSAITGVAAAYGRAGGQRDGYGDGAAGDELAPNTGRGGEGGKGQSGKDGVQSGNGGSGIVVVRFPY
jgi:hypothetical protein